MNMNNIWYQIDSLLSLIDFNKLWKGFKRYNFVLYDDEKVYFGDKEIKVDNRFVGNTAIDYDGERIAIWKVSKGDLDNIAVLTSNIVHEMFHAHQIENEEKRFPNDIKGLNVPFEVEYHNMKSIESKLLVDAIRSNDYIRRLSNLIEIISLREMRSNIYKDAAEYEFKIETIEGAAEYVGIKALRIINKVDYENRIISYLKIITDNNRIFNTREFSYLYGSMLLVLLDLLNIELSQKISDNSKTVMEELMNLVKDRVKLDNIPTDPTIEENLNKYQNKLYMRFKSFHSFNGKNHEGLYSINGFDPMNMYKLGNEILHEHFINLYDHDNNKSIFIKGPAITVYNEDESQVINYITIE